MNFLDLRQGGAGGGSAKAASAATAYSMIMQAVNTNSVDGGYKLAERQGVFAELAQLLDPTISITSAKISEAFNNATDANALASSSVFRDLVNGNTYLDDLGRASDELFQYYGGYAWENLQYDAGNVYNPDDGTDPANKGGWMSPDGLHFAWIDNTNNVRIGVLSTAYDLSTLTLIAGALNTSSLHSENSPSSVFMKPDGSKLYFCGNSTDNVFQYSLTTAFDLTTASYDGYRSLSNIPQSLHFSSDGSRFFYSRISGAYSADLSIPWDVVNSTFSGSYTTTATAFVNKDVAVVNGGFVYLSVNGGAGNIEVITTNTAYGFDSLTTVETFPLSANGGPFCADYAEPQSRRIGIISLGVASMLEIRPTELQAPA